AAVNEYLSPGPRKTAAFEARFRSNLFIKTHRSLQLRSWGEWISFKRGGLGLMGTPFSGFVTFLVELVKSPQLLQNPYLSQPPHSASLAYTANRSPNSSATDAAEARTSKAPRRAPCFS